MKNEDNKSKEGAALWRAARQGWHAPGDGPALTDGAPDALLLAAYLDGGLGEDEAARLEARLAGEPELLDELLALRDGLAAGAEPAPASVIARARTVYPERPALKLVETSAPSLLERLFGLWLRPAVPAVAVVALLLACAGAFELGRYQANQFGSATQTAGTAESDVPAEFVLGGLL